MKNFILKMNLSIVTIAIVLVSLAERLPYERYQTIVERQMFGPPPEGFDPSKRPSEVKGGRDAKKAEQELTKEQEKLKSAVRFSMINVTPDGETAVGFTDSSNPKEPRNYYLKIGETRGGWTVKEADSIEGTMTIVKGDVEVELSLGGDSAKGAGKTSSISAQAANGGASAKGGSLRARRQQREAQRNARMDDIMKRLEEREAADAKRREEETARREKDAEEKAAREAERQEQQAKLKDLAEQLKRAREERKSEESEKSDEPKEEE